MTCRSRIYDSGLGSQRQPALHAYGSYGMSYGSRETYSANNSRRVPGLVVRPDRTEWGRRMRPQQPKNANLSLNRISTPAERRVSTLDYFTFCSAVLVVRGGTLTLIMAPNGGSPTDYLFNTVISIERMAPSGMSGYRS